jgi:hypothetical protein
MDNGPPQEHGQIGKQQAKMNPTIIASSGGRCGQRRSVQRCGRGLAGGNHWLPGAPMRLTVYIHQL